MSVGTIILVILLFLALGSAPLWRYSREWSYAPSGIFGLLFVVLLVVLLSRGMGW